MMFVGIDPTAGPLTFAVLDRECNLVFLSTGEFIDVCSMIQDQRDVFAAVNAPVRPNIGLVKERLGRKTPLHSLRGADIRQVEYELREHGILISPTPSRSDLCPAWMQLGFEIHRGLQEIGFLSYPSDQASLVCMETHPHAAFCALLGQIPLPKPTLEGRLQRQLALHQHINGIHDPMEVFEEITRYKLLKGILPMELIYGAGELDAMAAALTAYFSVNSPESITLIGDQKEGQVILPTAELKDQYS